MLQVGRSREVAPFAMRVERWVALPRKLLALESADCYVNHKTWSQRGSNCTGGHHLGLGRTAVIRNRGVAAKQGFLMHYTKDVAIGTEVSVRYKESGRLSGVVVKRGSTVSQSTVLLCI